MVIMALDHVRDYFHADAFIYDPLDLSQTNIALYFTRWITHFCAPVFVFLAGTSAFLVGKKKGKGELSRFLLTRGLWLILLELTVVNFGWFMNIQFKIIILVVIWAIGIGMIVLAAIIHLPFKYILLVGVILVGGHNMLDSVHVEEGPLAILWSVLHEFRPFFFGEDRVLLIGYPIIAWTGIMTLGYCFGSLYSDSFSSKQRQRILIYLGTGTIVLFILIRFINIYGDPFPWESQPTALFTFLSFLNTTKYPPSLLYVLMTLGPAILFLAFTERQPGALGRKVIVFGRVPLFYYILHLYFIHILAIVAAMVTGYGASSMFFSTWITMSPELQGYGFGLPVVYVVWVVVVLGLYPLCRVYEKYRRTNPEKWWLRYL